MRNRCVWILALGLLSAACGGVSSHEEAMAEQIDIMEDMVALLEGVNDEASAEAASGELDVLAQRFKDLAEARKDLPRPDAEEVQRMMDKHGKRYADANGRLLAAVFKIGRYPELGNAVKEALKELG